MSDNKEWTKEELEDLMKTLEDKDFKWPVYHANGLVTVCSGRYVGVMRADVFNNAVKEAAQKYTDGQ